MWAWHNLAQFFPFINLIPLVKIFKSSVSCHRNQLKTVLWHFTKKLHLWRKKLAITWVPTTSVLLQKWQPLLNRNLRWQHNQLSTWMLSFYYLTILKDCHLPLECSDQGQHFFSRGLLDLYLFAKLPSEIKYVSYDWKRRKGKQQPLLNLNYKSVNKYF